MKTFYLLTLFLSINSYSQLNKWAGTYLYNVQLPEELNNEPGVCVNILYKNEPLPSSTRWIAGKKRKLATEFFYNLKKSDVINNVKLPFQLPAKTYSWLLNKEVLTEIEKFPKLYSIQVVSTGKYIKNYPLPQQFDINSNFALEIQTLQAMTPAAIFTVFQRSNYILNVAHKNSKSILIKEVVKKENDTIITFSVQDDGIPKWLSFVDAEYKPNNSYSRTTEILEFTGYWYNQKLYINRKKEKGDFPMQCYVKYILTDLQGNTCSCQVGAGEFSTGNCREIIRNKKVKVEVWVKP